MEWEQIRAGCSHLKCLRTDEWEPYRPFFDSGRMNCSACLPLFFFFSYFLADSYPFGMFNFFDGASPSLLSPRTEPFFFRPFLTIFINPDPLLVRPLRPCLVPIRADRTIVTVSLGLTYSAYLESLCDYLYDDLHPRIFHEQRLDALCAVCTVLQVLMVLDGPFVTLEEDEDDGTGTLGSGSEDFDGSLEVAVGCPSLVSVRDQKVQRAEERDQTLCGLGELRISGLLRMVLQDAQARRRA